MIDAHLHLQDCLFGRSAEELVSSLRDLGISTLSVNGTCPDDWGVVSKLAESFEEVVPSFGVHPWKLEGLQPDWRAVLTRYLEKHPEAGIGEIGLDKWIRNHDLSRQKEVFHAQMELAASLGRPVTVHCLQAWGSLLKCWEMTPYRGTFLLHSYGGPVEMISRWVKLGAFFSISGYFFREDKTQKLLGFKSVPEDRVLLETDAPDMALPEDQVRFRSEGGKNDPANLKVIYELYGRWSGLEEKEVLRRMQHNFALFREGRSRSVRKNVQPGIE